MIGTLLKRVRAALMWNKAIDMAAVGKSDAALKLIHDIEELGFPNFGSTRLGVQVGALKASMLTKIERYESALNQISRVQMELSGQRSPEAGYLLAYLSELAHFVCSRHKPLHMTDALHELLEKHPFMVDLKKVPAHITRIFPLPNHPNWNADA